MYFKVTTAFVILPRLTSVPSYDLLCVQVKLQLSERQSQLDVAQKEARALKEELEQVTLLTQPALPIFQTTKVCGRDLIV